MSETNLWKELRAQKTLKKDDITSDLKNNNNAIVFKGESEQKNHYNVLSFGFTEPLNIEAKDCSVTLSGCTYNSSAKLQSSSSLINVFNNIFYSGVDVLSEKGSNEYYETSTFRKNVNITTSESIVSFNSCIFNGMVHIDSKTGTITFENCDFLGFVDFCKEALATKVCFKNCRFYSYINLKADSKSNIEFSDCLFMGGICLECLGTVRLCQNKYNFSSVSYLLKNNLKMEDSDLLCGKVGQLVLENEHLYNVDDFPHNTMKLDVAKLIMINSSLGKKVNTITAKARTIYLIASQINYTKWWSSITSNNLAFDAESMINNQRLSSDGINMIRGVNTQNLLPTFIEDKEVERQLVLLSNQFK